MKMNWMDHAFHLLAMIITAINIEKSPQVSVCALLILISYHLWMLRDEGRRRG